LTDATIYRLLGKKFDEFQPLLKRYSEIKWAFHQYRQQFFFNYSQRHLAIPPAFKALSNFEKLFQAMHQLFFIGFPTEIAN
jgi:hypothetical protein